MNQKLAIRRLWWKEFRQLWPLVVMLLGIGAVLHLLFLPTSMSLPGFGGHMLVFLGLPGLFAVGTGALLVGQEKELRTLNWLATLPIPARDLIRVKLGVSLIGLVFVWLCSLGMMSLALAIIGPSTINSELLPWPIQDAGSEFTWPLHSLFLLLAGLALAWKFKSSFVSLLAIVPLAFLPLLSAMTLKYIFHFTDGFGYLYVEPSAWLLMGCQVVFIAAAFWFGWRAGLACLGPIRPVVMQSISGVADLFSLGQSRVIRHSTQPPMAALIWQSAQQNRAVLIGTTGMLVMAGILTLSGGGHVAILLGWLAISWLGVSAFQGDRLHQRIRFLADRGVSARLTWFTRHVIPICILVLAAFGLAMIGWVLLQSNYQGTRYEFSFQNVVPTIAIACVAGLIVYAISQWVSQLFLSPIVSTITAPLMAVAAFAYAGFAFGTLGAPIWLLSICVLIPLAVTFISMNRWMDGRLGRAYWMWHASSLAACVLLPAIPFLVAILSQPAMPRAVSRELSEAAQRWRAFNTPPTELVLTTEEFGDQDGAGSFAASMRANMARLEGNSVEDAIPDPSIKERRQTIYQNLSFQLANHRGAVASSARVINFLRAEAILLRMNLQVDVNASNEELLKRYRNAIVLLTTIDERMRLSPRLVDQDYADQIEIWLLRELKQSQAKLWLGDDVYSKTARVLGDSAGRNEARRRAIALSWFDFQAAVDRRSDTGKLGQAAVDRRSDTGKLGGYPLRDQNQIGYTSQNMIIGERRIGLAVGELWIYLKSGEKGTDSSLRESIAQFWNVSPELYGLGPGASYWHADDLDKFSIGSVSQMRFAPGAQWFADWERQAVDLARL